MPLEAKIEVLSEQITQLTDAVTVLKNVLLAQGQPESATTEIRVADTAIVETAEDPNVRAAIAAEKAGSSNATDVDPNANSSATTGTSQPSSGESRTVTYDDVKNITIAVSKIGKAKAVAGLSRFGVLTAKALNESQWLKYVVYMERVQKGEIDPESSHE